MKSKKPAKSQNFDFHIYDLLRKGYMPPKIVEKTNEKKQNIYYHLKQLKALNLINQVSYGVWEVTNNVSENQFKKLKKSKKNNKSKKIWRGTSERPESDLHALQIWIPILEGKIKDHSWKVKEKLRNWTPKYTSLPEFKGLEIKNNNNKSLTIYTKQRKVKNRSDIDKLVRAILEYIKGYFKVKHNVTLDTIGAEVKNMDIATDDKNSSSMRANGDKYSFSLGRKCRKILPNDNRDAKVWCDSTPYPNSVETNDDLWWENYLLTGERVKDMHQELGYLINSVDVIENYEKNLSSYNKNVVAHLELITEIKETNKQMQEYLKEMRNFMMRNKQN